MNQIAKELGSWKWIAIFILVVEEEKSIITNFWNNVFLVVYIDFVNSKDKKQFMAMFLLGIYNEYAILLKFVVCPVKVWKEPRF